VSDTVYVAWQDSTSRSWHTFARLTHKNNDYEFAFTKGADRLNSVPRELFRMDLKDRYRSNDLISLFKNKLPPRSRSDFLKMATWLNLRGDEKDFDLLAKFGLIPGTDSLLVYPEPDLTDGRYTLEFFVHGIRHMHKDALYYCESATTGDRLLPLLDVKNEVDGDAVALRPLEGTFLVGYVPSFYSTDLRTLLSNSKIAKTARIEVVRNNHDAPIQLRLLCRFTSDVPFEFKPLDTLSHEMISGPALAPV
jgi:hypothetical protein